MTLLQSRASPWRLYVLPLLAMLLAAGAQASYGLVLNGGFEKPEISGGFEESPPQTIADWTVGDEGVDLIHDYWPDAEVAGQQSLDLNQLGAGSIWQNLTTKSGENYTLSFMYSGNPELTRGPKTMEVYWGGSSLGQVTFNTADMGNTRTDMMWQSKSYLVTASGTSTELRFVSLTEGACGPALDLVSVTPEPSSWALLGLAVGVPLYIRRRKRS